MNKNIILIIYLFSTIICTINAVGSYNGPQYTNGLNAGYKSGWSNAALGPLMGEAGIRNQRMSFPCSFFDTWGYNILYDNNSFKSAKIAGQSNFTAFITYNQSDSSLVPTSIYEPIFINGVVNKDNHYAECVSKIVSTYKSDVKIYEIYNEPDWVSDWTVVSTWKTSPPTDAQLARFQGDIYTYVRLLRISWEVAKSIDPTCFITVGGLGYPEFLDAVLRYTDNSTVTNDPTRTGKNYIDAISTHFYPIYSTSKTNSDAYLNAYIEHQNSFKAVTNKYQFNPSIWIVTETGAATKTGGGYYASESLARNYFLKLPSISVVNGVCQNHIFILGDTNSSTNAFANMGLFYDYENQQPNAYIKRSSRSLKTWDYHLFDKTLNSSETTKIQSTLPNGVIAFAYSNSTSTCYLVWANTTNFQYDENTTSIQVQFNSNSISSYNYLNVKNSISGNGKVSIPINSDPLFIYTHDSNNENNSENNSENNPNSSTTIKISFIFIFLILSFILF